MNFAGTMWKLCLAGSLVLGSCNAGNPSAPADRTVRNSAGAVIASVTTNGTEKSGVTVIRLPDGRMKYGLYAQGLKHGTWLELSPHGDTMAVQRYSDGLGHGIQQRYRSGALVEESTFINGLEHGIRKEWHANGMPAALTPFLEGKEHGIAHRWALHDSAHVGMHVTGPFERGVMHGTWRRLYRNGTRCGENPYLNGLREGVWTIWSMDGTVLKQVEYRNDRKVRTIVDKLR